MTDDLPGAGRRARKLRRRKIACAAAGVTSLAGGLGAMGWAASSSPAAATPKPAVTASADPRVASLLRTLESDRRSLVKLRTTVVATLRQEQAAERAAKAAAAAAAAAAGTAVQAAPAGSVPAMPDLPPVPQAVAAPPAHTTTGASHAR